MIAFGTIKESFKIFLKNKMLLGSIVVLMIVSNLLLGFLYFGIAQCDFLFWIFFVAFPIYKAVQNIVLIDVVNSLRSNIEVSVDSMKETVQRYFWPVLLFPIGHFFLFFVVLYFPLSYMPFEIKNRLDSISSSINFVLFLLYLLPYFFSSHYIVLEDMKFKCAVCKAFKLLWMRCSDALVFLLFLGIAYLFSYHLSAFLSFGMLTMRIGILIIFNAFIWLWALSSITIYFKKLEDMGAFDE